MQIGNLVGIYPDGVSTSRWSWRADRTTHAPRSSGMINPTDKSSRGNRVHRTPQPIP